MMEKGLLWDPDPSPSLPSRTYALPVLPLGTVAAQLPSGNTGKAVTKWQLPSGNTGKAATKWQHWQSVRPGRQ